MIGKNRIYMYFSRKVTLTKEEREYLFPIWSNVLEAMKAFIFFYKKKDYEKSDSYRELLKELGVKISCRKYGISFHTTDTVHPVLETFIYAVSGHLT